MHKNRGSSAVLMALLFALAATFPGIARQGRLLVALLQNGDFEGDFYPYGSGYVAEYWVPYDLNSGASPPQYLRSTTHRHDGLASQQIWADAMPWYSGIMQTTLLTSQSRARIQAGKRYTVHVWVHSIYGGSDGPIQHDRILKRVGIHPMGGIDPKALQIVWTPWHGQDRMWVQINAAVEAGGDRLTVFVEAEDEESGGQDQLYIDGIWLEEDGVPTPTRTTTQTPTATRTPEATETLAPTATPAIAVLRTLSIGIRPQGVGCLPRANRFFVANHGDDTVSSLEGFFGWRHTTLPSEGHRPSGVAVDPERCPHVRDQRGLRQRHSVQHVQQRSDRHDQARSPRP